MTRSPTPRRGRRLQIFAAVIAMTGGWISPAQVLASPDEVDPPTAAKAPAPAAPGKPRVEVLDPEEYALLLGEHAFTLQWIGWNHPGKVRVEEKEGELRISGGQVRQREESELRIQGRITRVAKRRFTFVGKIVYRVTDLNQGRPCVRKGKMVFRRTGKRRYWRLTRMQNPCDGVTDYFDVYLRKPAKKKR